jgi:hypothetical protein
MPIHDIIVLSCIVGTFLLFGGILGWASWDESHRESRK